MGTTIPLAANPSRFLHRVVDMLPVDVCRAFVAAHRPHVLRVVVDVLSVARRPRLADAAHVQRPVFDARPLDLHPLDRLRRFREDEVRDGERALQGEERPGAVVEGEQVVVEPAQVGQLHPASGLVKPGLDEGLGEERPVVSFRVRQRRRCCRHGDRVCVVVCRGSAIMWICWMSVMSRREIDRDGISDVVLVKWCNGGERSAEMG